MSSIVPFYRSVGDLLNGKKFSIDEYQREYKWEQDNIVELLHDLKSKFDSCYHDGDSTTAVGGYETYFLGSIIVSRRETEFGTKNYLVDGQQRVSSLTLLLIYLYHAAADQSLPVVATLQGLIYSDSFGKKNFNLDIPERFAIIDALFNKTTFSPDGKDESIQTMYSRYQDIEAEELVEDLGTALSHFIYWLINKVGLIEISTDNDNDAYAIFETMNDRGKPLSPVDMLKAYLLAPIENQDHRKIINGIWKKEVFGLISWGGKSDTERDLNFFKAWFRAQYADSIRERKEGATDKDWELVGNSFHRWARDHHVKLGWGTEARNGSLISSDLPFFAAAYKLILEASTNYTAGLEAVFYNAKNEFTWQNTVLLAPLKSSDDEKTVRTKIALTANFIDIWIMRRVVNYIRVSYSSAAYSMFLLSREIRQKSVDELSDLLLKQLDKDDVDFSGSKSRGRDGILDLSLNLFSRRYIYHILARITSFVEKGSGMPDLFPQYVDRERENPCDIEHIWANHPEMLKDEIPDANVFAQDRNHIGGLLLLPADVNRSLQDMKFSDKAPHYAKQNLYAASLTAFAYDHQPQFEAFRAREGLDFKPYTHFGKAEQRERRELVSKLVRRIWSTSRLKLDGV